MLLKDESSNAGKFLGHLFFILLSVFFLGYRKTKLKAHNKSPPFGSAEETIKSKRLLFVVVIC